MKDSPPKKKGSIKKFFSKLIGRGGQDESGETSKHKSKTSDRRGASGETQGAAAYERERYGASNEGAVHGASKEEAYSRKDGQQIKGKGQEACGSHVDVKNDQKLGAAEDTCSKMPIIRRALSPIDGFESMDPGEVETTIYSSYRRRSRNGFSAPMGTSKPMVAVKGSPSPVLARERLCAPSPDPPPPPSKIPDFKLNIGSDKVDKINDNKTNVEAHSPKTESVKNKQVKRSTEQSSSEKPKVKRTNEAPTRDTTGPLSSEHNEKRTDGKSKKNETNTSDANVVKSKSTACKPKSKSSKSAMVEQRNEPKLDNMATTSSLTNNAQKKDSDTGATMSQSSPIKSGTRQKQVVENKSATESSVKIRDENPSNKDKLKDSSEFKPELKDSGDSSTKVRQKRQLPSVPSGTADASKTASNTETTTPPNYTELTPKPRSTEWDAAKPKSVQNKAQTVSETLPDTKESNNADHTPSKSPSKSKRQLPSSALPNNAKIKVSDLAASMMTQPTKGSSSESISSKDKVKQTDTTSDSPRKVKRTNKEKGKGDKEAIAKEAKSKEIDKVAPETEKRSGKKDSNDVIMTAKGIESSASHKTTSSSKDKSSETYKHTPTNDMKVPQLAQNSTASPRTTEGAKDNVKSATPITKPLNSVPTQNAKSDTESSNPTQKDTVKPPRDIANNKISHKQTQEIAGQCASAQPLVETKTPKLEQRRDFVHTSKTCDNLDINLSTLEEDFARPLATSTLTKAGKAKTETCIEDKLKETTIPPKTKASVDVKNPKKVEAMESLREKRLKYFETQSRAQVQVVANLNEVISPENQRNIPLIPKAQALETQNNRYSSAVQINSCINIDEGNSATASNIINNATERESKCQESKPSSPISDIVSHHLDNTTASFSDFKGNLLSSTRIDDFDGDNHDTNSMEPSCGSSVIMAHFDSTIILPEEASIEATVTVSQNHVNHVTPSAEDSGRNASSTTGNRVLHYQLTIQDNLNEININLNHTGVDRTVLDLMDVSTDEIQRPVNDDSLFLRNASFGNYLHMTTLTESSELLDSTLIAEDDSLFLTNDNPVLYNAFNDDALSDITCDTTYLVGADAWGDGTTEQEVTLPPGVCDPIRDPFHLYCGLRNVPLQDISNTSFSSIRPMAQSNPNVSLVSATTRQQWRQSQEISSLNSSRFTPPWRSGGTTTQPTTNTTRTTGSVRSSVLQTLVRPVYRDVATTQASTRTTVSTVPILSSASTSASNVYLPTSSISPISSTSSLGTAEITVVDSGTQSKRRRSTTVSTTSTSSHIGSYQSSTSNIRDSPTVSNNDIIRSPRGATYASTGQSSLTSRTVFTNASNCNTQLPSRTSATNGKSPPLSTYTTGLQTSAGTNTITPANALSSHVVSSRSHTTEATTIASPTISTTSTRQYTPRSAITSPSTILSTLEQRSLISSIQSRTSTSTSSNTPVLSSNITTTTSNTTSTSNSGARPITSTLGYTNAFVVETNESVNDDTMNSSSSSLYSKGKSNKNVAKGKSNANHNSDKPVARVYPHVRPAIINTPTVSVNTPTSTPTSMDRTNDTTALLFSSTLSIGSTFSAFAPHSFSQRISNSPMSRLPSAMTVSDSASSRATTTRVPTRSLTPGATLMNTASSLNRGGTPAGRNSAFTRTGGSYRGIVPSAAATNTRSHDDTEIESRTSDFVFVDEDLNGNVGFRATASAGAAAALTSRDQSTTVRPVSCRIQLGREQRIKRRLITTSRGAVTTPGLKIVDISRLDALDDMSRGQTFRRFGLASTIQPSMRRARTAADTARRAAATEEQSLGRQSLEETVAALRDDIVRVPGALILSVRRNRLVVYLSQDRPNVEGVIDFMQQHGISRADFEVEILPWGPNAARANQLQMVTT